MWKFVGKLSNRIISLLAGVAAFLFTLAGYVMLTDLGAQVAASVTLGLFALTVVWVAAERPNGAQARASAALIDRLLAVRTGDLDSPAPPAVRAAMPELADAVDGLFERVRSNLDSAQTMALYDAVTTLPNRVHFRGEAEQMLRSRGAAKRLALLFIDLDGFKDVNDRFGHAQGDRILTIVADRLREVVRAESRLGAATQPLLARLAGDEFTMLFPAVLGEDEAKRIAERVLTALNVPYSCDGQTIDMGASIGVALCPRDGEELSDLMKAADTAMYHAKARGRSQLCLYSAKLSAASDDKAVTEQAISDGLRRGEFEIAFQPQIGIRGGAILAGSAILRWNHPDGGVRLPDSFLRTTGNGDLAAEIGDWTVDAVAAALGRWHEAGLTQRLSLSVGPRHLERVDYFKRLRAALKIAGAPARMLELELSQALATRYTPAVLAELGALRSDGASIALDEFGSGYTLFERLKEMPLDRVTLSREFIADIDRSDAARTLVGAMIGLIRGLGCEAAAKGVERKEQLEALRALGCDRVQGHALAPVVAEADFLKWVRSRQATLSQSRRSA